MLKLRQTTSELQQRGHTWIDTDCSAKAMHDSRVAC